MGYEIELKAHVSDGDVSGLLERIRQLEGVVDLGEVDKEDLYWADSEDSSPRFRTRYEVDSEGPHILFTSKPLKTKDIGTEYNVENEFSVAADQWDKVRIFVEGLGFVVCRHKYKKGRHFCCIQDGYPIHVEVLEVRFLGFFLEMEITGEDSGSVDKFAADKALHAMLNRLGISESAVEPKGYNKMLKECGHLFG